MGWVGINSKRGLKWGVIEESFQKHLEIAKGKNCPQRQRR